jgi:RNA polymerase sigma-70 factor (ECF subfamily)
MGLPLDALLPDTDAIGQKSSPDSDMASADGGDPSAWRFRLAVARHHRAIYRVCYGILGDQYEAEDVTQETFLRYWQLSGEVRGAKAWLVTVARNKCLDRLRSTRRFVDADPEVFEQQTDSRDPEWHASRDESASRLQRLVSGLPEPQRSLVLLFDVEGLTGAECAEALGLNVNQVKVYLHRARRHLRRALEESHD